MIPIIRFRFQLIAFCLTMLASSSITPADSPANFSSEEGGLARSWALVIDINQYPAETGVTFSSASDPAASGQALARLLEQMYGYHSESLIVLHNQAAQKEAITKALAELSQRVGPRDNFFAFISAAVVGDEKSGSYLIPHDGKPNDPWTLISQSDVQEFLIQLQARSAFFVINGCFQTPVHFKERFQKLYYTRGQVRTRQLLTNCLAPKDPAEAGVFTKYLIAGLQGEVADAKGMVPASRLADFVREKSGGYGVRLEVYPETSAEDFVFVPQFTELNTYLVDQLNRSNDAKSRIGAIADLVKSVLAEPEERRAGSTARLAALMLEIVRAEDEDPAVKDRAIRALGQLKHVAAVSDLGQIMANSPDRMLRKAVIEALIQMESEAALPHIQSALRDSDPFVQTTAIRSLAKVGDASLLPEILELLNVGEETEVRVAALEVIPSFKPLDEAAEKVAALLNDPTASIRKQAVNTLSGFGRHRATPLVLLLVAKDADASVRQAAAFALGSPPEGADRSAIEKVLAEALRKDEDATVREAAAFSLGQIGGRTGEKKLMDALGEKNENVRRTSAEALGNLRSREAVKKLVELLQKDNPEVARAAAIALGKIGDERAIEPLLYAVKSENLYVRAEAEKALEQIKTRPDENKLRKGLLDASPRVRAESAQRLAATGDSRVVLALLQLFADNDYEVRQTAINSVAGFSDDSTFSALAAALGDAGNFLRRQSAATALGIQGNPSAVPTLMQHYRNETNSAVRAEVIRALGKLKDEQALPTIANAIRDEDNTVRQAMAEALGNFSSPQALKLLQHLARDDDPQVRQIALDMLKKSSGY